MGGPPPSHPGVPAAARCLVMGVVNVTPASFSDGGTWFGPEDAIAHGLELAAAGADIVDVGGESTRPGALRISEDEELRRGGPRAAPPGPGGGWGPPRTTPTPPPPRGPSAPPRRRTHTTPRPP